MATASAPHSRIRHHIPLTAFAITVGLVVTLALVVVAAISSGGASPQAGSAVPARAVQAKQERLYIGGPREIPRRSPAADLRTSPANDGSDRLGARP